MQQTTQLRLSNNMGYMMDEGSAEWAGLQRKCSEEDIEVAKRPNSITSTLLTEKLEN